MGGATDGGEPGGDRWGVSPAPGHEDAMADLVHDLARWAAESRERDAAASRSRKRWLDQQAAEEATFAALLLSLGESRTPAVLGVAHGNPVHGLVASVGLDFCAVQTTARGTVLVRLDEITEVRLEPGQRETAGVRDDPAAADMSLSDVLFGLAGERPEVVVSLRRGGSPLAGELRAVGVDVATVRTPGDPPVTVYVPLAAVSQVSLRR